MESRVNHILFWTVYALFMYLLFSSLTDSFRAFMRTVGIVGMQMLVFYVNFMIALPRYYNKNKFVRYWVLNFFLVFISVYTIDFLIRLSFYIQDVEKEQSYAIGTVFNVMNFDITNIEIIFNHMMHILLAIFMAFLFFNFIQQKRRKEKEILLTKAEKNFLVSQINPHFLFNTLNNIYSLTFENNKKGADAIIQLSKMLDYSLYGSHKETIALKDEIKYIQHFINLFKLKDDRMKNVVFDHKDTQPETYIAPMLLVPFVENAFKHGNIENTAQGKIIISLKTGNGIVLFKCFNTFMPKKSVDASNGIGVKNVIRRLELLYPGKHKVNIQEEEDHFSVYLSISVDEKT